MLRNTSFYPTLIWALSERPRTPHLNGKVERSHRVDDQEFYQLLDKDGIADDIHVFNDRLREWEDYCDFSRKRELECHQSLRTLQSGSPCVAVMSASGRRPHACHRTGSGPSLAAPFGSRGEDSSLRPGPRL